MQLLAQDSLNTQLLVQKLILNYFQVVNVSECNVQMLGTKVEVKLRKAEPSAWKNLFISNGAGDTKSTPSSESSGSTGNLESRVDAVDLSDL